jgi:membrane dipeptidase
MKEGNLSASFFACFVEPEHAANARERLDTIVQAVTRMCVENGSILGLAKTTADIRRLHQEGKLAIVLAIEGAHPIDDDLNALEHYAKAGVRYITLTHFTSNSWCDSSTDNPIHGGLSDLGVQAVREMNRLGIAVDISHVSDKAFWQVMELSNGPPMASHSCVRALSNHPRNLSDEMIVALAGRGGILGITWWPEYLSTRFRLELEAYALREIPDWRAGSPKTAAAALFGRCRGNRHRHYNVLTGIGVDMPSVEDVLDHIDHAVGLVGSKSVCIGTDHGGVDFQIVGIENCSRLPSLTRGLFGRKHSDDAIRNILGESALKYFERLEHER